MPSKQQKNLFFKILKKSHNDLYATILTEVQKGESSIGISVVDEVKKRFNSAGITEFGHGKGDANIENRFLFVAVIIKMFHPCLYDDDNKDIPLKRGLVKKIGDQFNLERSNSTELVKKVRVWLKYDIGGLKTKASEFYEQNISS